MWDRYSVDDATEKEVEDALGDVSESKSGDSSLRDWFGKSRSSDGTPGWVQLGGKYAGKPCAKQPGQTTKPKCGSSKMKRNLDKDEEQAAFRRKQRQDPNPDRKGKAINVKTEEVVTEKKGEKDACYHKVKSRYSVWPSAYASGALVKCRKVGAANWGNKSEEFSNWREELNLEEGQKCWKGYEKKGTKKMFGKTYNNCVKKEEFEKEVPSGDIKKLVKKAVKRIDRDADGDVDSGDKGGGEYGEFVPSPDGRKKIVTKIKKEQFSDWRSEIDEGAAWTIKSGKSESGGLNEKGRKSYERENPGSDLKAPSKKVGNPRRKSFCARMKGMKKKLTSSKTANDPDSRINKSLRAWNC